MRPYKFQKQLDSMGYEGDPVANVVNTLTEDEINEELRSAGYEERESHTNARNFDTGSEGDSVVSSERAATREEATANQPEKSEVARTPKQEERVRQVVEKFLKRVEANEINNGKQLQKTFKARNSKVKLKMIFLKKITTLTFLVK